MNALRRILIGCVLLTGCAITTAQDAAARHAAATNQLQQLAAAMTERCLTDIGSAADWQREKPELRRQLAYMLGLAGL